MLGNGNQLKPWLDLIYRRRYWILVPSLLGLAGGLVVLSQMPRRYVTSTTILVTPQRVPEEFVPNTVTSRLEDRVAILSVSVLSRAYLEPVAREFDLIGPQASEAEISAVVGNLAATVQPQVDRMRPPKWFKIQIEDANPKLAAGVANALAAAFIEENTKMREGQAGSLLATAEKFLVEIKTRLDQREEQLARYKEDKLWEMPEQFQANVQLLNNNQARIATIASDIQNRVNQLNLLRMQAAQGATAPVLMGAPAQVVDPAVPRYQQLQRELHDLELRYTDTHPDVALKREEIAAWAKANPQVLAPSVASSAAAPGKPPMSPLEIQIEQVELEIKKLEKDKATLESQTGVYQSRIISSPSRQQEVALLTRDLDTLRKDYETWLGRKSDAERALTMEIDNQAEQFRIQDRARIPSEPSKPVPAVVILMGLAIGLGVGAGASLLLEVLDNSVRTEEDFEKAFPQLPLLASIPDLDRSSKRRKRRPSRSRAAALGLFVLALSSAVCLIH